jgi:hypothetical protein
VRIRSLNSTSLMAALVAVSTLPGCSGGDSTGPGPSLVGTWNATSFSALGVEFIAQGMGLSITFTVGGAYTLTITNDLIGACDPDANCSQSGTYTATASQVTIDPETADAVTFAYTIQGETLTLAGSVDGVPVAIVLRRQ